MFANYKLSLYLRSNNYESLREKVRRKDIGKFLDTLI